MGIIISIILFLITVSKYWSIDRYDFWWHKWFILSVFAVLAFSYKIYKQYSLPAAMVFAWTLFTSIIVFASMDNKYTSLIKDHSEAWTLLRSYAGISAFSFISIIILIMFLKKYYSHIEKTFLIMCILNSLLTIFQWASGADYLHRYGFSGNGTINGCLIAFTYPLLFTLNLKTIPKLIVLTIPVVAVFCTLTSVPVGVLTAAIVTYIFLSFKGYKKKISLCVLLSFLLMAVGWYIDQKNFLSSAGRFELYKYTWNLFNDNLDSFWLTGSGAGTFFYFGPLIQIKNNFMVNSWNMWLHNDWLQILFETGFIGLILPIILTGEVVIKSIYNKQYYLTACCTAYAAAMLFNYPIHYAIHAFFAAFLVAKILGEKNAKYYS